MGTDFVTVGHSKQRTTKLCQEVPVLNDWYREWRSYAFDEPSGIN